MFDVRSFHCSGEASDASEYFTGQTILVDGGISTGATRAMPVKEA